MRDRRVSLRLGAFIPQHLSASEATVTPHRSRFSRRPPMILPATVVALLTAASACLLLPESTSPTDPALGLFLVAIPASAAAVVLAIRPRS
ncbi:hypothetical protein BMH31_13865 [Leucobacter sp. OLIS6]|nr:hypothetical protein BMH27_14810 [Leucobacter sp. OLAS13]PII99438.1 hypothetical protein BMH29_05025 [Leucobacter sp. OLDS2]PIJ01574.1 hypothetical protein BMH31_13865 [Leucobacter sp. OLIS6]